jgi:cell division protease FtsH
LRIYIRCCILSNRSPAFTSFQPGTITNRENKEQPVTPATKRILIFIVGIGLVAWVILSAINVMREGRDLLGGRATAISHTELLNDAKSGRITSAIIGPTGTEATYKDGHKAKVNPVPDPYLVSDLYKAGVDVQGPTIQSDKDGSGWLWQALLAFGPMLLLVGIWVYMMRQQTGKGGAGPLGGYGKARAKVRKADAEPDVTFADVAGCDEAKEEVAELVDFLKDPSKFQKLGGRIPKGLLMAGPPGTGKTLLAKAIAGEARVPFFSISGSDFVEMFVGVGAARVRDLFEKAKANAPCIIFIDEIDAVGRQRGAGHGGGNDEREQTLNQMLVEMDGFEKELGVIVMAATNRPDILDSALMRPGRFDRQVYVNLPDVRGREQILNVHLRKIPAGIDVDVKILARGTPGMSGADLANVVNEAALFAARRGSRHVQMDDFEKAKDKVTMGTERKSVIMPEHERRNTAYHEAGHAVIAELLDKTDPVHKVSIIPRGRALGVTLQLPEGDRYSTDKVRLENTIAVLFGGRVAEVLFMKEATTGASNDYERATSIARNMVTRWGYSEVLGPMVLVGNDTDPHAGQFVSPETLREVDKEIRNILTTQYNRVTKLLEANRDKMEVMAKALLEWETIDADQVQDIMQGRTVRPPKSTTTPTRVFNPPTPPADTGTATPAAV